MRKRKKKRERKGKKKKKKGGWREREEEKRSTKHVRGPGHNEEINPLPDTLGSTARAWMRYSRNYIPTKR